MDRGPRHLHTGHELLGIEAPSLGLILRVRAFATSSKAVGAGFFFRDRVCARFSLKNIYKYNFNAAK